MSGNHFFALIPDEATRQRLAAVAERIRAWGLDGRWVHPDDYHLTVCFLGATDEDEAALLPTIFDEVASAARLGPLRLCGLGAFGGRFAPKVVYAAIEDGPQACADLAHDLHDRLGLEAERDFRPHITLIRPDDVHGDPGRDWPDLLAAFGNSAWGECRCDALGLFISENAPRGRPRHRQIASWPVTRF